MRATLLTLVCTLALAGAATAQTAEILPLELTRVPVSGLGSGRYWQQLVITLAQADAPSDSTLSIVMPPGVVVFDQDEDGLVEDDVRLMYAAAAAEVPDFFIESSSTPERLVVGSRESAAAGGRLYLQFPVTVTASPNLTQVRYGRIRFADPDEVDIAEGPQLNLVTQDEFAVLASMNAVVLAPVLAAESDTSTSALGTFFPEEAQVLVENFPDLVFDSGPGRSSNLLGFGDGDDGNDVEYRFFWSTEPGLRAVGENAALEALVEDGEPYSEREGSGRAVRLLTRDLAPGTYYLYVTATITGSIPLARSRALVVRHEPVFGAVGPESDITLDSGGLFDLDGQPTGRGEHRLEIGFELIDHDDAPSVQLFYSAAPDLEASAVQVSEGAVSGLEGAQAITGAEALEAGSSFTWDILQPVPVIEGDYYLYAAASDGITPSLGRSAGRARVRHAPFLRLDALEDGVLRGADTLVTGGATPQRFATFTWGRRGFDGDADVDDDARIDLYYSTRPATGEAGGTDFFVPGGAGQILPALGQDTQLIFGGIAEDPDERLDNQFTWDLWALEGKTVPEAGVVHYVYGVISDSRNNRLVQMNGGLLNDAAARLVFRHPPAIRPVQPVAEMVLERGGSGRVVWEDMDLDDDARIRVLLTTEDQGAVSNYAKVAAGRTWVVNSADGRAAAEVDSLRDLSENSDTDYLDLRVDHLQRGVNAAGGPQDGSYFLYLAITDGARFADGTLAVRAPGAIQVQTPEEALPARPILLLPESFSMGTGGVRQTFEVRIDPAGERIDLVQASFRLDGAAFSAVDQDAQLDGVQPFVVGAGFSPAKLVTNRAEGGEDAPLLLTLEYFEPTAAEIAGLSKDRVLATFALLSRDLEGTVSIDLEVDAQSGRISRLERDGRVAVAPEAGPLSQGQLAVGRATVRGAVALEGRQLMNVSVDFSLRRRGAYRPLEDALFAQANDADPGLPGVQVALTEDGSFELLSVPTGRLDLHVDLHGYLGGWAPGLELFPAQILENVRPATPGSTEGRLLGGDVAGYLEIGGQSRPDNEVTLADWDFVAAFFGVQPLAGEASGRADITGDGRVDIQDLSLVGANFLDRGPRPVYKMATGRRPALSTAFDGEGRLLVEGQGLEGMRAGEFLLHLAPGDWEVLDVGTGPGAGRALLAQRAEEGGLRLGLAQLGRGTSFADGEPLLQIGLRPRHAGAAAPRLVEAHLVDAADGRVEAAVGPGSAPRHFGLHQNFPNPFNPETTIAFSVSAARAGQMVRLEVFDVLGRSVAVLWEGELAPGEYRATWDGRDAQGRPAASGVYIYRLYSGGESRVKRMVLIR